MSATWPKVRLGEVLTPVSREEVVDATKEYRLLGVRLDGRGPFLRELVTGANTAAKKLFRVATGDFIYSRLFAWRGAFGVISEELDSSYVSAEFPTFVPVPDRVDVEFLRYWFRLPATLERVTADCSGSTPLTRNRFKEPYFLALDVPLPPLAEQRRIVARIEKLAALIDEARALRHQAAEEAQALISAARSQFFVVDDECPCLCDVCADVTDGTHDTPRYVEEGIPFLTGKDISPSGLDFDSARFISEDDHRRFSLHCPVERGDVLVTLIGTIDKAAIVETDRPFSIKNVGLLKPNHSQLDSRYLFSFLQSSPFQEQAVSYAKSTAQAFVGLKKLRMVRIPVPALSTQRRIVSELGALQAEVDALKGLQAETAAELDALLPSILNRAFKGEL